MNVKTIHQQLPSSLFARVSKSHIVNIRHIVSLDNHNIYLMDTDVPLGDKYREAFFSSYVNNQLISR